MSISIDGVQVVGHNCLLFTKSKGIVTQYLGLKQLQDKVHVTAQEIQASCEIITAELNSSVDHCASIAVANAARKMADGLREVLKGRNFEKSRATVVTRDPAHSIDLAPKNLALEESFIGPVITVTNNLMKFIKIDRIGGLKAKLIDQKIIEAPAVVMYPDSRMYLVAMTLARARLQKSFLTKLPSTPEWELYLKERTRKQRSNLEETLGESTISH